MHNETLDAKLDAGEFYKKTLNNLKNASIGEEAAELTTFLLSDKSNGINGKFLSAIWDNWKNDDFQKLLKEDKDFAVLRRIDNKNFYKK